MELEYKHTSDEQQVALSNILNRAKRSQIEPVALLPLLIICCKTATSFYRKIIISQPQLYKKFFQMNLLNKFLMRTTLIILKVGIKPKDE